LPGAIANELTTSQLVRSLQWRIEIGVGYIVGRISCLRVRSREARYRDKTAVKGLSGTRKVVFDLGLGFFDECLPRISCF